MAKIIKMTPECIEQCVKAFKEVLTSGKFADGKVSFAQTFDVKDAKTTVYFTAEAYSKMIMLLQSLDKEVGWHGCAERLRNNTFLITDILVYPQEVTGATVNTDQEPYQNWMMSLDDETFSNLRMHGHSHVNMGTSPSSVDIVHQERILEQLKDDMFYIFMIWNKKLERNIKIYDLNRNILFEDSDITVGLYEKGVDFDEFIKDSKALIKERSYTQTMSLPYKGVSSKNQEVELVKKKVRAYSDLNYEDWNWKRYGGGYKQ